MTDHLLDRELRDLFAQGPRQAPALVVDGAVDLARGIAQRQPRFPRLDLRAWPAQPRSLASPDVKRGARVLAVLAVVALLVSAVVAVGAKLLEQRPIPASIVSAGTLRSTVHNPSVHALGDGRVLILGYSGDQVIATFLDPGTGESTAFATHDFATGIGPALPLPDGRIVVSGIVDSTVDEPPTIGILDVATGTVTLEGMMLAHRFSEAEVVLADGRVLISGGLDLAQLTSTASILASVEVFDPKTATFSALGPLLEPRMRHSMLLLADGRVLVVGDSADGSALSAEVYEPLTGRSTPLGTIGPARGLTSRPPVRLSDGRILIPGAAILDESCSGGESAAQAMYVFDPATNKVVARPPLIHFAEGAAAMLDGRVVVFGLNRSVPGGCGTGAEPVLYPWLGIYDPETGTTLETEDPATGVATLQVRIEHEYVAGTALSDGRIALVADDSDKPVDNPVDILTIGH